ncbi:MAG: hypothetical protein V2A79_09905 [Planctomycetota bacterium]
MKRYNVLPWWCRLLVAAARQKVKAPAVHTLDLRAHPCLACPHSPAACATCPVSLRASGGAA